MLATLDRCTDFCGRRMTPFGHPCSRCGTCRKSTRRLQRPCSSAPLRYKLETDLIQYVYSTLLIQVESYFSQGHLCRSFLHAIVPCYRSCRRNSSFLSSSRPIALFLELFKFLVLFDIWRRFARDKIEIDVCKAVCGRGQANAEYFLHGRKWNSVCL